MLETLFFKSRKYPNALVRSRSLFLGRSPRSLARMFTAVRAASS